MEPGIVGEARKGQGEEQGAQKAVGAVLCRDDNKVGTWPLSWKQKINIMVAGDLVHQRVLKDRKAVAKADDDVAPEIFPSLQEKAVRTFGWVLRRELR